MMMVDKKKKIIAVIYACICLCITMLPSKSICAAEDNSGISICSIMTIEQTANTPSGNVSVVATLTVSESQHTIIEVKNARVFGYTTTIGGIASGIDGSSFSLSSPTIWNGGKYATITVTYMQKGVVKSEVCTFYPI